MDNYQAMFLGREILGHQTAEDHLTGSNRSAQPRHVIEELLMATGSGSQGKPWTSQEPKQVLSGYFEKEAASSILASHIKEDTVGNYLALRARDPRLVNLAITIRDTHKKSPIFGNTQRHCLPTSPDQSSSEQVEEEEEESDQEGLDHHRDAMLNGADSSSVLIDSKEFEVFDKVHEPGFVFQDFFRRLDKPGIEEYSWETNVFDIYEPEHTPPPQESTAAIEPKEKKNIGMNKYSFKGEERKREGGLDYFQSETNVLQYKRSTRPDHSYTAESSPMVSKVIIHESGEIGGTRKNKQGGKDKGLTRKRKKEPNSKPIKGYWTNENKVLALEELKDLKFKANDNLLRVIRPKDPKGIKKKNSIIHPQTRSNSREQVKHTVEMSPDTLAMRSQANGKSEGSNPHLKKKMRIRDRFENMPPKETTISLLAKKKKRNRLDDPGLTISTNIINRLLFNSLKQSKEGGLGNTGKVKPQLALESSYLTDDLQSRLFESAIHKSPKAKTSFGTQPLHLEFLGGSNSKPKASKNHKKLQPKSKKQISSQQSRVLISTVGIQSPTEATIRRSLDKLVKTGRLDPLRSAKREEIKKENSGRIGEFTFTGESKGATMARYRSATAETAPYMSHRSRTAQKQPQKGKKKQEGQKKAPPVLKDSHKNLAAFQLAMFTSPGKTKRLGKKSSSLLER